MAASIKFLSLFSCLFCFATVKAQDSIVEADFDQALALVKSYYFDTTNHEACLDTALHFMAERKTEVRVEDSLYQAFLFLELETCRLANYARTLIKLTKELLERPSLSPAERRTAKKMLALAYAKHENFNQAGMIYLSLVKVAAPDPYDYQGLINAYLELEDSTHARLYLKEWESRCELNKAHHIPDYYWARYFWLTKQMDSAVKRIDKHLSKRSDLYWEEFNLGAKIHHNLGNQHQACLYMQEAWKFAEVNRDIIIEYNQLPRILSESPSVHSELIRVQDLKWLKSVQCDGG